MKPHLYIFNFKKLLIGIFYGLFLLFIGSIIVNYIIENSNHRLSKIYSSQKIESSIFFIGNSRSVPFNNKNLNTHKKILNLSQNSMNSFQVENIIKAIKSKIKNEKIIYVELTSLADYEVQCQYSIFFNLNFYYEKDEIAKNFKRKYLFEKIMPISKINNELFFRILYYYFFPKRDQLWTNSYKMPKSVCKNPKTSDLMRFFFSSNTEEIIHKKSTYLLDKYSDENTKILFFISPVYQKENFALKMEKNYLNKNFKNLIKLNVILDNNFFKNCEMFTDTLHLSTDGVYKLFENKIFNRF